MLDMVNVGLRTLMCIGFIFFVVRPMLMGMFRRETDRIGIEQAAQFAVMSAFKSQFDKLFNAPPPTTITLEPEVEPEPLLAAPPLLLITDQPAVTKPNPFMRPRPPRQVAAESEDDLIDVDSVEDEDANGMDAMKQRRKDQKKKSKPTIPAELLNDANSFDDKLMVARYVVEHEKARVASVIKSMIKIV